MDPDRPERQRSLTVRLAANTIVQGAGILAGAAIGFFTFVAVTRGLGEAFGDFTAAMAFLFIPVVIADLEYLDGSPLREISAAPERTEPAMRASLPFRTCSRPRSSCWPPSASRCRSTSARPTPS